MSNRFPIALLFLVFAVACQSTTAADRGSSRAVVDRFLEAMNHADIDALGRLFTEDATAFLPLNDVPQRIEGREAIAAAIEPMFVQMRHASAGPEYMHLTAKNVLVQNVRDVAVLTFDAGSGPVISRRTLVVRRTREGWRITHLHGSNVRVATPAPGS